MSSRDTKALRDLINKVMTVQAELAKSQVKPKNQEQGVTPTARAGPSTGGSGSSEGGGSTDGYDQLLAVFAPKPAHGGVVSPASYAPKAGYGSVDPAAFKQMELNVADLFARVRAFDAYMQETRRKFMLMSAVYCGLATGSAVLAVLRLLGHG